MTEPVVADIEPLPADPAPAIRNPQSAIENPPAIRNSFVRRNFYLLALLVLTLIGGGMRMAFLDKPPIWFDEAATYARTCASYVELLESLEEAGFGPLHYSAYWWIKNGLPTWGKIEPVELPVMMRGNEFGRTRTGPRTKNGNVQVNDLKPLHPLIKSGSVTMTPFMMRLIPAISGTLMIPAMYWLGRELSGRRSVALVAALLTTFSAYLLNYSRDAKMYMDFWLFVTLHVAALLWWLRTRTMVAWWCWIIAGTIMVGLHLLGAIVLVLDLIIVLTAKKPYWRYHLPVLYTPVAFVAVPAEWIGRTTWKLAYARQLAPAQPSLTLRLLERFWRGFHVPALFGFLVGVMILTIGPFGYYKVFNKYAQRITERGWMGSGLQWIQDYNQGRTPAEHVKFTASAFMTGWEWPRRPTDLLMLKDGTTLEGDIGRAFKKWKVTKPDGTKLEIPDDQVIRKEEGQADEKFIKASTLKFLKYGSVAIGVALLLGIFPWRFPWRAKPQAAQPFDRFTVAHGWRRMLYIALWVVLPPFGVYLVSQPAGSIPKLPSDSFKSAARATSLVRWSNDAAHLMRAHPFVTGAIVAIAIAGFILCAPTWRGRLRQAGALIAIALITILICATFRDVYPYLDAQLLKTAGRGWKNHQPMWMPRYLGLIIPALFVLSAILILRLPTRYVRGLAILIFVVVNMYQFGGRVFAGSEPPVDRMVADTLAWRKSMDADGAIKMYYNVSRPNLQAGLGPGTGVLGMPSARYYWAIATGSPSHPDEIRGFGSPVDSRFPSFTSSPNAIKNEVTKNPKINKLIVWDSFATNKGDSLDRTLAALGPSWQKIGGDELFYARDHWTWRDLMTIRRRVYVKNPASATGPSTAPTTSAPVAK